MKRDTNNIDENEGSSDSTFFQLLNPQQSSQSPKVKPVYSFTNILKNNVEHVKVLH